MKKSNYDKFPFVRVPLPHAHEFWKGWGAVANRLRSALLATGKRNPVLVVECYTGVFENEIRRALEDELRPRIAIDARDAMKPSGEIERMVAPDLGDDPVFGYMTRLNLADFFAKDAMAVCRQKIAAIGDGLALVIGPGSSLIETDPDVFVFADMPRWEGQLRQRRGEASNLGAENSADSAARKYKRSFFVDWRVCDRHKRRTLARWDFLLDTTSGGDPRMITGGAHLAGLAEAVRRPFRVVPFFDPGPWGGQWMKRVCELDPAAPNYAWCFDCVPEENSLRLGFGDNHVEIPALNLVFRHPRELLGERVYARFGAEFPIRFDLLDTMGGGNLSLQVHPTIDYARENFGLCYTQDESYYLLDAEPGASVYLGCAEGQTPDAFFDALGAENVAAQKLVARFPAKAHDHFLIPAGTLHCSGSGALVLEISATPYIFTFKLWDWARMGLDGKPRPIHRERARAVMNFERDARYARELLVNRFQPLAEGEGWREERTGLHATQFIETRRHWFTALVPHDTGGLSNGSVHVVNLVAGEAALIESPTAAFEPFELHYAETVILPAQLGPYTIRPLVPNQPPHATLQASVR